MLPLGSFQADMVNERHREEFRTNKTSVIGVYYAATGHSCLYTSYVHPVYVYLCKTIFLRAMSYDKSHICSTSVCALTGFTWRTSKDS